MTIRDTIRSKRDTIRSKFEQLGNSLNERTTRLWTATEAVALGHGGIAVVANATGVVPSTIGKGVRELEAQAAGKVPELPPGRIRRPGGGRKSLVAKDPSLVAALESMVDADCGGDPMQALRWTAKSTRKLADALKALGHQVSHMSVLTLLRSWDFRLNANRKMREGPQHADTDAQFKYINAQVAAAQASGNPAISIDTKKKELVGPYKNPGREWRPKGSPVEVDTHDFMGDQGRASPYGVYDIFANEGWVSVGISADTAEFAVNSIRSWWNNLGKPRYPNATSLLVTADCGGSNGYRLRLWRLEMQSLANELGLEITVCHLPPGTSKWNRIEHRMFSFISINWRDKPLVDHQTIINLISATTATKGLRIFAALDDRVYTTATKVTDDQLANVHVRRHEFHGEWNYTFVPEPRNSA